MNNRSECGHHWSFGHHWSLGLKGWATIGAIFCALTLGGLRPAHAQLPANSIGMACANLSQTIASGAFGLVRCDSTGAIPVTGTFSATLGGFRPTVFGTPVSASSVSSTQTLPAGTQVVATNTSTTTGAYCALGATATTSSQFIPPSSWFGFAVSGDTQLSCITASSTATINTAGGSGLPTGAGGGGSSGGGSSAITTWAGGTLGAMANYGTSPGAVLVPGVNAFVTNAVTLGGTLPAFAATPTVNIGTAPTIAVTGTFFQATQPISATSLPLPTGAATVAKQPALGTAGTASADVITVQGITSMTALKVDPSAFTSPISASSLPLPTLAATSTKQSDGTQKTQIVDGSNNVIAATSNALNVQCANCSGSGASAADEASYTAGSSVFAPSGGFFQTTATTAPLTTGQQGLVQMTATRAFFTNLRNAAGAEVGVAAVPIQVSLANTAANATAVKVDGSAVTQPVSGTVTATVSGVSTSANQVAVQGSATAGSAGTVSELVGGTFQTSPTTLTNGQQAPLSLDNAHNLNVNMAAGGITGSPAGTPSTTQVVSIQGEAGMTKVLVTPDSVALPANQSVNVSQINAVTPLMGNGTTGTGSQRVTLASDNSAVAGLGAGATGSSVPANAVLAGVNVGGNTTALVGDPCQTVARTYTPVNIVTATTTRIIAPTSAKKTYVCGMFLYPAGTTNIGIVEGTGGTCGTGTAGVIGGTTAAAGIVAVAQAGFVLPNTGYAQAATAGTNVDFCLITSAAIQVSGVVVWVQL